MSAHSKRKQNKASRIDHYSKNIFAECNIGRISAAEQTIPFGEIETVPTLAICPVDFCKLRRKHQRKRSKTKKSRKNNM